MKTTLYENFPFPEPEDYGNGALDLQILAEAFDAGIAAMLTNLAYMTRRETCVITSSVDSPPLSAGSGGWGNFDTILYNNGFTVIATPSLGIVPSIQGSYLAGVYGNCQLVGAVTAHSQRQMRITANIPTGPTHVDIRSAVYADTTYDSGVAGGDFLSAQGAFDFQFIPTNPPTPWTFNFNHENIASNMVVKAGAIAWFTRISDLGS